MGTQFMSNLMKEVCRLLSIAQLTTTPNHPACNGLVETFNGTLKQMLRRMAAERPKDWDKYIAPYHLLTVKFLKKVWGFPQLNCYIVVPSVVQ